MPPEQLGPFKIGHIIGKGGMGAVYKGVHTETGEDVAVKVLLGNLEEDVEIRQRFEIEIETLKRLRHPNIVQLFGFGEEQEILYYVMEYVDGPSLQQEIRHQRLFQWYEVAKIGLELCFALKHAHDRGIIHRDIKPANILLEQSGRVKLSDYGIAHFFGAQRLTEINSIVGTLEYMSPEQATGGPIGPRSDIYSLGAVLYTLLVGHIPFSAKTLPEILRKHQLNTFESIRSVRNDVPDELERILYDLMKIRIEERPNNAYLAAKRFQSLLQALMGPPERILVKPANLSEVLPSEPVSIPYNDEKKTERKTKKISKSGGEGEPVDLNEFVTGNSGASVITDIFVEKNGSVPDDADILKFPAENSSLADSFGIPGKDNGKPTTAFSDSPFTEHRTLSVEDSGFAVSISSEEEPSCPPPSLERPADASGMLTVTGFGTGHKPSPYSFSEPASEHEADKAAVPEKSLEKDAYERQRADSSASAPVSTKGLGYTAGSASSSRFVSVKGENFDDYSDSEHLNRPWISLQTICVSIALILIGFVIYYMLQPLPAEQRFERIRQVLYENGEEAELSLLVLQKAETDIKKFLEEYPQHPMVEQVRFYKDELELGELERRLERRQTLGESQPNIVERVYLDAVSHIKSDPEKTLVKLKALIAVFGDESQNLRTTAQCVELARRRLAKLEKEIHSLFSEQIEILLLRLKAAERLDKEHQSERAEGIRRGIIELYQDKHWAKEVVEKAKKALNGNR